TGNNSTFITYHGCAFSIAAISGTTNDDSCAIFNSRSLPDRKVAEPAHSICVIAGEIKQGGAYLQLKSKDRLTDLFTTIALFNQNTA
ncbi:MAG: hypothetical protein H7069_08080, partial [Phormidesmis sp. FL-bin-119]|nr:hypothetical protein [Pedobacter sp.]